METTIIATEVTTLYKKDSKGKIRVLNIFTNGADLVQTAGLYGGNLVENRKTCKGKNIGRSNETLPEEQALLEMQSKIAEKLKEDYFRTMEEAQTTQVVLPMLAKDYGEQGHKITYGVDVVHVQPKLDGMRALGFCGKDARLVSREGSIIDTMPHIVEQLADMPEGLILDGELYAHGLNFQENMKLIKKNRGAESEQVKYHVYDLLGNEPFQFRMGAVTDLLEGHLQPVFTKTVSSEQEMQHYHQVFLGEGYEGTIVRWGRAPYKVNGRSENLLKYKDFQDMALTILDVVPSDARPEWGQPVFELNGERFSSGMRYSHKEREYWLQNKQEFIGKTAELRFFGFTDAGLPRFPVCIGIRLDK